MFMLCYTDSEVVVRFKGPRTHIMEIGLLVKSFVYNDKLFVF